MPTCVFHVNKQRCDQRIESKGGGGKNGHNFVYIPNNKKKKYVDTNGVKYTATEQRAWRWKILGSSGLKGDESKFIDDRLYICKSHWCSDDLSEPNSSRGNAAFLAAKWGSLPICQRNPQATIGVEAARSWKRVHDDVLGCLKEGVEGVDPKRRRVSAGSAGSANDVHRRKKAINSLESFLEEQRDHAKT